MYLLRTDSWYLERIVFLMAGCMNGLSIVLVLAPQHLLADPHRVREPEPARLRPYRVLPVGGGHVQDGCSTEAREAGRERGRLRKNGHRPVFGPPGPRKDAGQGAEENGKEGSRR